MDQKAIELILFRQIASCLAISTLILDPQGKLIFFNEMAEKTFGVRFSETGELLSDKWSHVFIFMDKKGQRIETKALSLYKSITTQRISHEEIYLQSSNDSLALFSLSTVPIVNIQNNFLGVISFIQEFST